MGQYLRAMIMGDKELRERLLLGFSRDGWDRDQASVMQAACDLAAGRYFGSDYDVRDISKLVSLIRQTTQEAGKVLHGQLEMEAVIRHALAEVEVDIKGINAQVALEIQGLFSAVAAWRLGFTESQVDELLANAEQTAFERGFKPPL